MTLPPASPSSRPQQLILRFALKKTDSSFSALIIVCLVERTYRNRTGLSFLDPNRFIGRIACAGNDRLLRSGGRGEAMAAIEKYNGGVGRLQSRAEESFLLLRNANGTEEGETF